MKEGMDFLIIGRFLKPFGVRGEMKVLPATDTLERFGELSFVYVHENREWKKCDLEGVRFNGNRVLLKLKGYDTREVVEKLTDKYLYIDRAHAVPLEDDNYYCYDLCNCRVSTTAGKNLGAVCDIQNAGSCDVYVVRRNCEGEDVFYIPAVKDVIRKIDIRNKEIIIEEIEGLF